MKEFQHSIKKNVNKNMIFTTISLASIMAANVGAVNVYASDEGVASGLYCQADEQTSLISWIDNEPYLTVDNYLNYQAEYDVWYQSCPIIRAGDSVYNYDFDTDIVPLYLDCLDEEQKTPVTLELLTSWFGDDIAQRYTDWYRRTDWVDKALELHPEYASYVDNSSGIQTFSTEAFTTLVPLADAIRMANCPIGDGVRIFERCRGSSEADIYQICSEEVYRVEQERLQREAKEQAEREEQERLKREAQEKAERERQAALTTVTTSKQSATTTTTTAVSSSDTDSYERGDANHDKAVNVRDAAYIAREVSKGRGSSLPPSADFNKDGSRNVRDAAALAKSLGAKSTDSTSSTSNSKHDFETLYGTFRDYVEDKRIFSSSKSGSSTHFENMYKYGISYDIGGSSKKYKTKKVWTFDEACSAMNEFKNWASKNIKGFNTEDCSYPSWDIRDYEVAGTLVSTFKDPERLLVGLDMCRHYTEYTTYYVNRYNRFTDSKKAMIDDIYKLNKDQALYAIKLLSTDSSGIQYIFYINMKKGVPVQLPSDKGWGYVTFDYDLGWKLITSTDGSRWKYSLTF